MYRIFIIYSLEFLWLVVSISFLILGIGLISGIFLNVVVI